MKTLVDNGPCDPFTSSPARIARRLIEIYGFSEGEAEELTAAFQSMHRLVRQAFREYWTTQDYEESFTVPGSKWTLGELIKGGKDGHSHPVRAFLDLSSICGNPIKVVSAIELVRRFGRNVLVTIR